MMGAPGSACLPGLACAGVLPPGKQGETVIAGKACGARGTAWLRALLCAPEAAAGHCHSPHKGKSQASAICPREVKPLTAKRRNRKEKAALRAAFLIKCTCPYSKKSRRASGLQQFQRHMTHNRRNTAIEGKITH